LVDITIPRWRKESIMSLGNAIVPQVAIQLFKTIQQYNSITSSS
jgi:DNA (cytosine-5)-methyltransferase 1